MSSKRDPYPFPRLENDANFTSVRSPNKGSEVENFNETGFDASDRLYSTQTLSSTRRDVTYYDPQAPRDSLDFVLKCEYDHHGKFMKSKAEVLQQPETSGSPHGRILKNREEIPKPLLLEDKELVECNERRKTTIHTSKGLAIESHHSAGTNQGYSRKHDGGFYSC